MRWLGFMCRRQRVLLLLFTALVGGRGMALAEPSFQAAESKSQRPLVSGRVVTIVTVLDGTVHLAAVDVELRSGDDRVVLARTLTDNAGQAVFPDVPPGRYVIQAARSGLVPTESAPFDVQAGETSQVLLDVKLSYSPPGVEVRAPIAPESVQPVSTSDMLSGAVLDIAPVEGDDFQSLLPLLPGVVRGPDGRLRAKGGQPSQGALQISSTSLVDPSSGDFDLELPGQSLESIELLANPFAAEYGRFSTSVTQIRTRRGTNDWEFSPGNLVPRFRNRLRRLRSFEPRFSARGALIPDRLFVAEDIQFRYVDEPVRSLEGEPTIGLRSFDSFFRFDGVLSSRHTLGGLLVAFPRRIERLTMHTFRPADTTPSFSQNGASIGVQDRFAMSPNMVLESTVAARKFEIHVEGFDDNPMVYGVDTQSGNFFNDHEREVRSIQWVETLSLTLDGPRGQHLLKFGLDVQHSRYEGDSISRPVEIRRADQSLAERIVFDGETTQLVSGAEVSWFAQDRWRIGSRVTLEYGLRMDREDVIERVNWSPRGGVSISVLPDGRGILRGGVGRFRQRTPLNIGAFGQYEGRTVTRFLSDGSLAAPAARFANVAAADLRTPEAIAGNVEWNQRFSRRLLFKVNFLRRSGKHEYILEPDPATNQINLQSTGTSRYWELELTGRYLAGARRDLTFSYVRSRGTADLNHYDQFYGNLRNPIVRANQHNLIATDVPHRLLIRGTIGLPGEWDFAPVIELRTGFPWSAVDEYQDFVGGRNRAGRLPRMRTFDFSLSRRWRLFGRSFRAGVRIYNLLGTSSGRDVQQNIASPDYGRFFNPIERSIGFVLGSAN
jgi:hypothetical protein